MSDGNIPPCFRDTPPDQRKHALTCGNTRKPFTPVHPPVPLNIPLVHFGPRPFRVHEGESMAEHPADDHIDQLAQRQRPDRDRHPGGEHGEPLVTVTQDPARAGRRVTGWSL